MHKRYKFDDDLSATRYSVKYVNENKKPIYGGFEAGMIIPGFRYVYPLFYNNKHIGSVENSFDVDRFISSFEETYNLEAYFIITKDIYDTKIAKRFKTKYFDVEESKDYKMIVNKSRDQLSKRNKLMHNISKENKKLIQNQLKDEKTFTFYDLKHKKLITYLAIKNIEGVHSGYFIVYTKDNRLEHLKENRYQSFIIISIIFIVILSAIYKDMIDRTNLQRKIDKKTSELKHINKNLEYKIYSQVKELRDKDATLLQQSRMADLGQMIANIAHQLKQPLNTIKIVTDTADLRSTMGDKIDIQQIAKDVSTQVIFMNETIDLFRNFFNPNKQKEKNDVNYIIKSTLYITKGAYFDTEIVFKDANILSKVDMYPNEIIQVVINILKNAKDIQNEKNITDKIIVISTQEKDNHQFITIQDNAGGIPNDIIKKVFEQYFSTKGEKKGTGIGLNLAKQIIEEKHGGFLEVVNSEFMYKNVSYSGAKFTIKLPIS
jgi:signal transduction histidine kinase